MLFYSAEKKANSKQKNGKDKEVDELDQVAGNAEDEIGDRIAAVRETELLYGPDSLLAVYGDMIVHICRMPQKFKVVFFFFFGCQMICVFFFPHERIAHYVLLRYSHSANCSASALPSATNTICCFSKSLKPQTTPISEATSSSRSETLLCLSIILLTRTVKSCIRGFRIRTLS